MAQWLYKCGEKGLYCTLIDFVWNSNDLTTCTLYKYISNYSVVNFNFYFCTKQFKNKNKKCPWCFSVTVCIAAWVLGYLSSLSTRFFKHQTMSRSSNHYNRAIRLLGALLMGWIRYKMIGRLKQKHGKHESKDRMKSTKKRR